MSLLCGSFDLVSSYRLSGHEWSEVTIQVVERVFIESGEAELIDLERREPSGHHVVDTRLLVAVHHDISILVKARFTKSTVVFTGDRARVSKRLGVGVWWID